MRAFASRSRRLQQLAVAVIGLLIVLACIPGFAAAYQVVKTNVPIVGDFALDNAKIELTIDPGSIKTTSLRVTNRTDQTRTFQVTVEDMKGTDNPSEPVVLLADEKGPYSLKDLIVPQISEFTLRPQEQIILPVTVAIPGNAEPGGRYGSVLFATKSSSPSGLGAQTISRLAALFFVRISGQANEEGALQKFALREGGLLLDQRPLTFTMLFRNTGNVHLDPYGPITIRDIYGNSVGELDVRPFYALPQSLRSREVVWKHQPLVGRYTATVALHRGYLSALDTQTVTFWVIPWKMIAAAVGAIIALLLVSRVLAGMFEIRRRV